MKSYKDFKKQLDETYAVAGQVGDYTGLNLSGADDGSTLVYDIEDAEVLRKLNVAVKGELENASNYPLKRLARLREKLQVAGLSFEMPSKMNPGTLELKLSQFGNELGPDYGKMNSDGDSLSERETKRHILRVEVEEAEDGLMDIFAEIVPVED